MSEELKPCPFCGGEACMDSGTYVIGRKTYRTAKCKCRECGVTRSAVLDIYASLDEAESKAIEAWNRRAERTCRVVAMDAAGSPPYRTGNWIYNELSDGCSECGYPFDTPNRGVPAYCPNCGAKVVRDD